MRVTVAEIAYSEDQIQNRIRDLANEIRADLGDDRPLLVSILKGSVVFLADLVRALDIDCDLDFMSISAYGGEVGRSGVVRIVKDLEEPLEGRRVLLIEDIVDTGFTLSYLLRTLQTRNPEQIQVVALIDKTVRRIAELKIDHVGFTSEEFLVGYGLDFQGRYRNLPYLVAVKDIAALAANPDSLTRLFQPNPG